MHDSSHKDVSERVLISITLPVGSSYTMTREKKPIFGLGGEITGYDPGIFILAIPAHSSIRISSE